MFYYHVGPDGIELVTAPLFLLLAFVTALGAGFLLSTFNVRYRDVPTHAPRIHAGAPVGLGVPYAVQEIPEKWQWILAFNPDDGGDQRLALGDARRPDPNWAQTPSASQSLSCFFVGGLAVFRSSEPRFADTI